MRTGVALVLAAAVASSASVYASGNQAKPTPKPVAKTAAAPRIVNITAGDPIGEKMTYNVSSITVRPGEQIRLRLVSVGAMPRTVMTHNWVLLARGSDPKKFADAAGMSPSTGYIPQALKAQILAATDMLGPGERTEVVFTAPARPGAYPFLCTFAGHFNAGMTGTLIVK